MRRAYASDSHIVFSSCYLAHLSRWRRMKAKVFSRSFSVLRAHSHTTMRFQPSAAHAFSCSASRQTLRRNFAFQNARFDFGAVACARRRRTDRGLHELSPVPLPPMLVPKAAAHLDERAALGDHDVRMAHDSPVADAEAVSVRPQHLPHAHLRQRVARVYRRHNLRPHLLAHRVHVTPSYTSSIAATMRPMRVFAWLT